MPDDKDDDNEKKTSD